MSENKEISVLDPMDPVAVKQKNPVVLAYVGDTVFDLYIRTHIVKQSASHVNRLHSIAKSYVNAEAQARFSEKLADFFTEDELAVFKRARNAKVGSVAKNMSVGDYHKATGLEAVAGYLFLTGNRERLDRMFDIIIFSEEETDESNT